MKLHAILPLIVTPTYTDGYETISKSLAFPPPTPLYNASRGYCITEEDNQCPLDEGVLLSPSDKIQTMKADEPQKVDYS